MRVAYIMFYNINRTTRRRVIMKTRRTSVDFDEDTFAALDEIKQHFDFTTMAQAIRKASKVTRDVIQK